MRRLALFLLSSSISWALIFQIPVFATDFVQYAAQISVPSTSEAVLSQDYLPSSELSCSLEEREAALSRFGCSCSTCISAAKQLQGQPLLQPLLVDLVRNQQGSLHPH